MFADVTWIALGTMSWTLVEPGVYLIAATLPSLRPLVHFFKALELETQYDNLLDRCSRAFSTHKYSEGSTTTVGLNSTSTYATTISAGNDARSAGFMKMEDVKPRGQEVARKE